MATKKEEREARREERRQAEAEEQQRARRQRLVKLVSAAVFLAVIAVVVVIVVSQSGGGSSGGDSSNLVGQAKVAKELKGIPQNGAVLGDPSAKATLIEYGDLQCSTCQFYAEQILPAIIAGPVRSGQAKIEFRPVEVIGPESVPASAAAGAAGEQGKLWSYIELFYANQGAENSGYVTDAFMTSVAKGAGVPDIGKWEGSRKSPTWNQQLSQHKSQFRNFGFTGTPSFAIQSGNAAPKAIPGQEGTTVLPLAALEAAIKQAG
jgi:protein-disulfide isomerase